MSDAEKLIFQKRVERLQKRIGQADCGRCRNRQGNITEFIYTTWPEKPTADVKCGKCGQRFIVE